MANDTTIKIRVLVTISKDSMSASVVLKKPLPTEPPITDVEILDALKEKNIIHGIEQDNIERIIREREYSIPVRVAKGAKPEKGKNSEFQYHFNTTAEHKPDVDKDGRIDYKNINFIQNVKKGTVLVTKIPAQPGEPGKNIYGTEIKGPDWKELPFKGGANTEISEDGNELIASKNGTIVFLHDKVSVNDVTVIKGDVDFNTGNIKCLGSVRVLGNVKTGFEIESDGDLEVVGNVEDCNIDIKGNIMVKGGFFGKGSGLMKARGDVYIKFTEGQRIEAGGDVVIGGEVVNCQILCGGNVLVNGKRGKIVGGEVRAHREIRASFLGAESGTQTLLSVAYNPELMTKLKENTKETNRLKEDNDRVKEVMVDLYKLKMSGKMTDDQDNALKKLKEFQKELPTNLENLQKEKEAIQEELKQFEGARIVADEVIYPGVKASFGLVYRDILEETEKCILQLDDNKIFFSELKAGD